MKLTKNLVTILSSLWSRYSIKKIYMLYVNVRIDMTPPFPLFAYVRISMDPPFPLNANLTIECPPCKQVPITISTATSINSTSQNLI